MANRMVLRGPSGLRSDQTLSFSNQTPEAGPQRLWSGDIGFADGTDRRFAFSRQSSFRQSGEHTPISVISDDISRPLLSRNDSSIRIPAEVYPQFGDESFTKGHCKSSFKGDIKSVSRNSLLSCMWYMIHTLRMGSRVMKRLLMMISLNVAYSTVELIVGIVTGRVGLISDAFHLTFGCGLLTFSLFAMAVSKKKSDSVYTYGYKRVEVLAAFTNALFLLFMAFSLAVEALHAFIQDESEHKHYLIISAVTNLLVNLVGVWFFRSYARINLGYRKAEDMNCHSVCLHVLADSVRSAGLILASWLLTLGVKNAEVLCMGLVSFLVFAIAMPLFKATGGILIQMAPPSIHSSALSKCLRQITTLEDVNEVTQARFWEFVPGHVVGSILIQVKKGADDHPILQHVHGFLHDLGVQELTVQTDIV